MNLFGGREGWGEVGRGGRDGGGREGRGGRDGEGEGGMTVIHILIGICSIAIQ